MAVKFIQVYIIIRYNYYTSNVKGIIQMYMSIHNLYTYAYSVRMNIYKLVIL